MTGKIKKLHKYLGLVMLLPFIAWAITGVFFFIKPGYKAAYESLAITTYPLATPFTFPQNDNWLEIRLLRSILGMHLLVKNNEGWQQLNLDSFEVIDQPSEQDIRKLINDAIQLKPTRYGNIVSVDKFNALTNTGIKISLNWQEMTLYQQGTDTDFINTMYKVHYLQWTGIKSLDKVLGIVGLALVLILAMLGVMMTLKRNTKH